MFAQMAKILGPVPTKKKIKMIWKAIGYTPWKEAEPFHFAEDPNGGWLRHKMMTGGEQAGKSMSAAAEAFARMFWGQKFWIVAPDYKQGKNEFNYIEAWSQKLGLWVWSNKPDRGSWKMRWVTGQTLEVKSTVDVATIAGESPDGILFVEAAQAAFEAFLRCYGRSLPRRGWLLVNGTFEKDTGSWFRQLWKAGQGANKWRLRSFNLPSWCNTEYYPGGLENDEIKQAREAFGEEHFQERFGGIPSKPLGVVHPEFDYVTHVHKVIRSGTVAQWEKDAEAGNPRDMLRENGLYLPEDTTDEIWVDPGYRHAYAVLFVTIWQGVAVVYHELYKHSRHSEQVADEAMAHERWERVKRIVMDISGNTHAGGNRSASDVWYRKTKLRAVTRLVPVLDGIERTRISLTPHPESGVPQLFLSDQCTNTAWELSEGYRFPSDRMGNPVETDKPEDKNNDAVKALVYGLTLNFGRADRRTHSVIKEKTGGYRTVSGWETLYGDGDPDYGSYEEDVAINEYEESAW